ncbi:MAG: hypothetical protein WD208_06610 [Dehalococcoidia bacterium]
MATCDARQQAQRGVVAIEAAIIAVAVLFVSFIAVGTLLGVSFQATHSGKATMDRGVAEAAGGLELRGGVLAGRGDVDLDGDSTINLSGNDEQAVVKITFIVAPATDVPVNLAPPYIADASGTDPDLSGLDSTTLIGISTSDFQVSRSAWTVSFAGDNNGDYFLDAGERAEITAWLHSYDTDNDLYELGGGSTGPFVGSESELLLASGAFSLQVTVRGGTAMSIDRVLPLELGESEYLH